LLDVFYLEPNPLELNVEVFEKVTNKNPLNSTQFVFVLKNDE